MSRVCHGTSFCTVANLADNLEALGSSIELGVNFFDASNAYFYSEEILGKAIAGRRDRVVICTKVHPFRRPETLDDPYEPDEFSREFLFAEAEDALRRLGTDYIDLYLLHNPDRVTPAEDVAERMDALVQAGKIRYWGVSNHSAAQVREFLEIGRRTGRSTVVATESYYNVAGQAAGGSEKPSPTRRLEREMFPVLRAEGIGLLAHSPMARGKLAPGQEVDPDSPLAALIEVIDRVASELGLSRAEVCYAWVASHPEVTSVLGAPERREHVEQAVSGVNVVLPAEALATLNAASEAFSAALELG